MSVRPFDSGSQFGAWRNRNCHRCAKYNPERFDGQCEIDGALGMAYMMYSGQVSAEIASRMGFREQTLGPWSWDCPEREDAGATTRATTLTVVDPPYGVSYADAPDGEPGS